MSMLFHIPCHITLELHDFVVHILGTRFKAIEEIAVIFIHLMSTFKMQGQCYQEGGRKKQNTKGAQSRWLIQLEVGGNMPVFISIGRGKKVVSL